MPVETRALFITAVFVPLYLLALFGILRSGSIPGWDTVMVGCLVLPGFCCLGTWALLHHAGLLRRRFGIVLGLSLTLFLVVASLALFGLITTIWATI